MTETPPVWESDPEGAEARLAGLGVQKGSLFSALPFGQTPLGARWAQLRPEAGARFPNLKLKATEDLHATLVYLGAGWRLGCLARIRDLALPAPPPGFQLLPEAVRMGRGGRVVALELHGVSKAWEANLIEGRRHLAEAGLRKAEEHDATLRLHVTLVETGHRGPSPQESADLDRFRAWIGPAFGIPFLLDLSPVPPPQLWLAGASRPIGAPAYLRLETFLDRFLG